MKTDSICVILAAVDGERSPGLSVEAFLREADAVGAEVLLVDATSKGAGWEQSSLLTVLRCESTQLVPELWAQGLANCTSRWVVLSTTAMKPEPGWLEQLIGLRERTGASAVGSQIVPAPGLNRWGRAVYLARYVRYLRPDQGAEPAGENVLYDRDELESLRSTWANGFWESEVHSLLKSRGRKFAVESGPGLQFVDDSEWTGMLKRRYAHGLRYGSMRALGPLGRFQALGMPLVPVVLARRAAAASWGLRGFGPAVWGLWLLLILFWAWGECLGILGRTGRLLPDQRMIGRIVS